MAVSVLAGGIWISITDSGRCSTRTRRQAEVAESVVLLLQMFYRLKLLLKHTNTNRLITILITVCQSSSERRTLHSDNFNEHSRRVYFVTHSCSAKRQCFSHTVYKLAYLLTYLVTTTSSMCISDSLIRGQKSDNSSNCFFPARTSDEKGVSVCLPVRQTLGLKTKRKKNLSRFLYHTKDHLA